ncbi:fumarylacetoacetate hydrolase family protein [Alteromonas sediminis]|uniref:Fumarylacetoacetate hydrolase family protein n=1 Tax=Alteromonas sediminis TaxID=2259342 RepID=A0A3N5XXD4_9ALTE|nr:fumarylacetoacetate hydrolase family protein [Alteromonas sediminis]RPJ65083.1 fumarylacetoacetate hydrolase family protein [Alteromonas sediminis]
MYKHITTNREAIGLPVGKVVCVGRNYHDHIKEMASSVTDAPLLFMKPTSAMCHFDTEIAIPQEKGECHNEIEVALLIKDKVDRHTEIDMPSQVWGVGLGLDLTLRDIQAAAKQQGHPWEAAKSFDNSCPLSGFVPFADIRLPLRFSLRINNQEKQSGSTEHMIFGLRELLSAIASSFTLLPGDVVLTGTPSGVGPLFTGDKLQATMDNYLNATASVTACR